MAGTALPLFVYGTLRAPELVATVLGHPASGIDAVARGHGVVLYPGRSYPALIRTPGRDAPGLLLSGLTAEDIALLDLFEGAEYARRPLKVRVEDRPVSAEAYWPKAAIGRNAPAWRYQDWRARHPEVGDPAGAAALRARLTAEGSG